MIQVSLATYVAKTPDFSRDTCIVMSKKVDVTVNETATKAISVRFDESSSQEMTVSDFLTEAHKEFCRGKTFPKAQIFLGVAYQIKAALEAIRRTENLEKVKEGQGMMASLFRGIHDSVTHRDTKKKYFILIDESINAVIPIAIQLFENERAKAQETALQQVANAQVTGANLSEEPQV